MRNRRKQHKNPMAFVNPESVLPVMSVGFAIAKFLNGDMTLDVAKRLIEINTDTKEYYDDSDLRI
jgi:hypothetical protein